MPEQTCPSCGLVFWRKPSDVLRKQHVHCSHACRVAALGPEADRFWALVDKGGPVPSHRPDIGPCWIWLGRREEKRGYGHFAPARGRRLMAHRWSFEAQHGPIPRGLFVLHRCDNPACVNPKHLRLGTHADNMADMIVKGRSLQGERDAAARLTEAQVREIRAIPEPANHSALGRRFGISHTMVRYIRNGENWAHVR